MSWTAWWPRSPGWPTNSPPAPADALPINEDLAEPFSSWRRLASGSVCDADRLPAWARSNLDVLADLEAGWVEAASGTTLAHTDVRADNVLLTKTRVVIVDWPYATAAAPWVDLLFLLPSVAAFSGIDPEPVWRTYPHARAVPDEHSSAVLAAIAGDFLTQSLRPPPPHIPGLRSHQRAKGEATLRWLRTRLVER